MAELKAHLALTVSNVERSRLFYETLLNTEPEKVRPGYAKFDSADPPLVLALIEGERSGDSGAFNHAGIRVDSTDDVLEARLRLKRSGLVTFDEMDTECCYARQDKIWITDPDGLKWEVFTVLDEHGERAPEGALSAATPCC